MNSKQFKKWLAGKGATFEPGKGGPPESVLARQQIDPSDAHKGIEEGNRDSDQEAARHQGVSNMVNLNYPAKFEKAKEGGFVVTFPDVPEAITQGDSFSEAVVNAASALETALEFYMEGNEDLPGASAGRKSSIRIAPRALATIKFTIYQTMRDDKVRKSELARRLGWKGPQVDRLLDIRHSTQMDHAEAALVALGKTVRIEFDERRKSA